MIISDQDKGSMTIYSRSVPKIAGALGARVAIGFLLVAGSGAGAAYAQECGCSVSLASLPAGQVIGQLTAVSGSVNVLGPNGWVPASAGTPLSLGSQIETGAGGSASLSVGGCSVSLGAQAAANLVASNQSLCVAVNETAPAGAPGNEALAGASPNNPVVMGIAAGTGLTSAVISVATQKEDAPASP